MNLLAEFLVKELIPTEKYAYLGIPLTFLVVPVICERYKNGGDYQGVIPEIFKWGDAISKTAPIFGTLSAGLVLSEALDIYRSRFRDFYRRKREEERRMLKEEKIRTLENIISNPKGNL